jgi:Zn-dependent protease with chaperone function
MVSPSEDILALLPSWVGDVSLFYIPLAFALTSVAVWLSTAWAGLPEGMDPGIPWYERSRRLWPARLAVGAHASVLPIAFGVGLLFLLGPLVHGRLIAVSAAGASALAVMLAGWRRYPSLHGRRTTARAFLNDHLALWAIGLPHLFVLPALLLAAQDRFDALTCLAIAMAFFSGLWFALGGGLSLADVWGLAVAPSDRVQAAVQRVAQRMQLPTPELFELNTSWANAYAFPLRSSVAVSRTLTTLLTEAELEAVLAHELGHLTEPKALAWRRSSPLWLLAPLAVAIRPLVGELGLAGAVQATAIVFIALLWLRGGRGSRLETRADALSHAHVSPEALTQALLKLHSHNGTPATSSPTAARAHPDLYDRLLAAGHIPTFSRPRPPDLSRVRWMATVHVAWVIGGLLALQSWAPALLRKEEPMLGAYVAVALSGGRPQMLGRLADHHYMEGEFELARRLYQGLTELRGLPEDATSLSVTLARLGRCEESEKALSQAQRLGASTLYLEDASIALDDCLLMDSREASSLHARP